MFIFYICYYTQISILETLLELPLFLGLFIFILSISAAGLIVAHFSRKMIKNKLTKEHERVGRLLFRVTAGLIALLVSLSYANERVHNNKIVDAMEIEAAMIITVGMRLNHFESDEAKNAFKKIYDYVELTINDEWKNMGSDPYFSRITQSLIEAYYLTTSIPTKNEGEALEKIMILNDISEIISLGQIRVYSELPSTPYLIYILLCGLAFMWIFFSVYKPDIVSLSFLTLYNILIAILIYFVFSLSNPFTGPLKIKPQSLIVAKTKGFDMYFK